MTVQYVGPPRRPANDFLRRLDSARAVVAFVVSACAAVTFGLVSDPPFPHWWVVAALSAGVLPGLVTFNLLLRRYERPQVPASLSSRRLGSWVFALIGALLTTYLLGGLLGPGAALLGAPVVWTSELMIMVEGRRLERAQLEAEAKARLTPAAGA